MNLKSIQLKITAAILFVFIMCIGTSIIIYIYIEVYNKFWVIASLFAVSGVTISLVLVLLIRKIVLKKIKKIDETVNVASTGDLDVSINVDSSDELGKLSSSVNSMIKDLKRKNERKIEETVNETTIRENRKYLQNIQEGMLMVDYGQIIGESYSQFLVDMFDRKEIAGQHLSDFLYPDKERNRGERKILEKYLRSLFNDKDIDQEILNENNPLRDIWISRDDGKRICIDASFQKIEEDGEIEHIMIIFIDKTEILQIEKKLHDKKIKAYSELESIASLLRVGSAPFQQFIDDNIKILNKFRSNIGNLEDVNVLNISLRDIHSLKCNASYYNFQSIEILAHNLEDILTGIRKGDLSRSRALDIILDDINSEFEQIIQLIDRFKEFSSLDGIGIYGVYNNDLQHFFNTLKIMILRNADYLGKKVKISIHSDYKEFPIIRDLKNVIIHLFRNALDHGIEYPDIRISENKAEAGHIKLSILKGDNGTAKIIVEDDGQGIDYNQLREKAVEKGFIKKEEEPGHSNLIRTLFKSGFSFRDDLDYSGSGIGLNAVKEDIGRLGGKISIVTEHHKGCRFTISIPPQNR